MRSINGLRQVNNIFNLNFRNKENDLAFRDEEVNRLTSDLEEIQVFSKKQVLFCYQINKEILV